jgi:hypothetical protein
MNVVAGEVVLGGPTNVKVAGALSPANRSFLMIASKRLVDPRGPKPVDLSSRRVGSGDVIEPMTVLSVPAALAVN